ncbi:3-oxoacyl-ACP synthase [Neptunitalea lumnitzerae]|uniref:3-oxoacyl-ACP synthase n=1 Tax=Neptunitalea lumnitzerae TaxID=2965509 RepID=A0ABQ5MG57_9FLAO|nr:3-oxoacyl-ACP synthase [Neptunitalea sp. Y10]GLB48020.1 hypothetical protein Y10_03880 [Neptunitalea sp. Y10]
MQQLKNRVLEHCKVSLTDKLHVLEITIKDLQESLLSETKSTAGDKHETGRAMVQLEMEKTGHKIGSIQQELQIVNRILADTIKQQDVVRLGSMVNTSNGIYLLSVGQGVVKCEDAVVYAVSLKSPIAVALIGKRVGEEISFMGKTILIKAIV